MTRPGPLRATALRTAAAAVAVVAALGPHADGARATTRVLFVDMSASCERRGADPAERAALVAGLSASDRACIVAFGERAAVAAAPAAPGDLRIVPVSVGPWATSLAAGLREAAGLVRAGDRAEFLIATDGLVTDGEAELAAAADSVRRMGGARILPPARRAGSNVSAVVALRGPGRAALGEVVVLEASGVAAPGGAVVELVHDGEIVESRRVDRAGPFRVVFARVADAAGLATWTARTPDTAEAPPAAARVVVAAPGSAAVVARGERRRALADASGAADWIDVSRGGASSLDRIAGQDVVVLDDLSADDAGPLAAALSAFVRGGGGLVVLGGERSWSAGGWGGGEPLEASFPLRATPPESRGAAIYLALDGSGSMGEPWPGAASDAPRDAAARDAARRLVRGAADGSRIFVRRFREDLVPAGVAPVAIDLTGSGTGDPAADPRRIDGERAIDGLPAPGGSTAFAPVLREALDLLATREEPVRVALFLTDGRSSEDSADLAAALARLRAAGVRAAVVTPGSSENAASDACLLRAAATQGIAVRGAGQPDRLAETLLAAERSARAGDPFVADRDVEPTGDAALLDGASGSLDAWPRRARRMNRTWAAPDASVLARTTDGLPLAALRSEPGGGRVAAIAARVAGDASDAWLGGDGGAALLRAMVRAARRRGSAAVRVETDGSRLLAALGAGPGGPPAAVEVRYFAGAAPRGAAALRDAGDGLVSADRPTAPDADRVSFVAADGTEVAAAGLDRPAAPEFASARPIDLDDLAERLRPGETPAPLPLRPAFAALAVLLLIAGSVKSQAPPAR